MIDYVATIERVLLDPELLKRAQTVWRAEMPEVLARNHDRAPMSLRFSDAGRCTRELWAELHGHHDLPKNWQDLLLKMYQGSLSGAATAGLIAAGLAPEYGVHLEKEIVTPDRIGHADIVVYKDDVPLEVVDCKWTAWSGAFDDPAQKNPHQCLQTADYAMHMRAPTFVILTSAPAAWKEPVKIKQYRYDTADWVMDVAIEHDRLSDALGDAMPAPDPSAAWRCKICRFSLCEMNKNASR